MSKGVNKWIGIGNVCQDPESKSTQSGMAVANFSVACNDKVKNKKTGQYEDKAEFVRIVAFGKLAEIIQQYVKKGTKVYIEGKIQTRKWQDSNGQDRYTTEIVANEMQMIGGDNQAKQPMGHSHPQQPGSLSAPPAGAMQAGADQYAKQADPMSEDIPF